MCVCICMHVCMYACMHVYMYICVYVYTVIISNPRITRTPDNSNSRYLQLKLNPLALPHNLTSITRTFIYDIRPCMRVILPTLGCGSSSKHNVKSPLALQVLPWRYLVFLAVRTARFSEQLHTDPSAHTTREHTRTCRSYERIKKLIRCTH